ncbi:uncharacterized protein MYCFIDRAFT_85944 [Pseudocercospora fijiensis CIRAD86]|uniref:Uncharacterized protein n=1 Tax=Pseudocercospora fijiensis (strain CIRAD86) TaxID=383855 RepID=N1QAN6_PSEFD|nr:uncharacterized protein MYCFIDRAFT_85944 [Pseudocercospora fijiensis CIRAD86]EME88052.1 hypothetical protein MYCFIDRAFT_85944 [Pseudocercospora fijiensis CIRAD86]
MGICASCLGLNRHPSHDREIDRLLNSEQPRAAHGAVDHGTFAQPDEEELRREREALEHITAQAADHMIDVLHPSQSDLDYGLVLGGHRSYRDDPVEHSVACQDPQHSRALPETEDSEEAAWLETLALRLGHALRSRNNAVQCANPFAPHSPSVPTFDAELPNNYDAKNPATWDFVLLDLD